MLGCASPRTSKHVSLGVALGLFALASSGCSAARWIADGLTDPPSRTAAEGAYGPGTAAPLPAPVGAGDLADAAVGHDDGSGGQSTTSVYVVSPALTWGELQLHRPYVITGELYQSHQRSPECTAESWAVATQPSRTHAEDVVRAAHVPFGVRNSYLPLESVLTLDREVMGDRVMRSGAYLVQRGPICFETFLEFSFFWAIGDAEPSGGLTYW